MANTDAVLQGVKDYTLELLGTKARDEAVDAANRAEGYASRAETAADQAGEDRVQTGADRRQTGEDRAQAGEDREAAEGWASQSKDAATLAITAAATVTQYVGDGFPEGKVTAPVGSIYTDRQSTAGAIRWIKTSGTGNTGWRVEYGDAGWRNISSLVTGIEFSGSVLVRRRAEWLDFRFAWFNPDGVDNVSFTLPTGWRGVNNDGATLLNGSGAPAADLRIGWAGDVTIRRTASHSLDCTVSIPATPTWPGSYIGTPA